MVAIIAVIAAVFALREFSAWVDDIYYPNEYRGEDETDGGIKDEG